MAGHSYTKEASSKAHKVYYQKNKKEYLKACREYYHNPEVKAKKLQYQYAKNAIIFVRKLYEI